MTADGRAVPVTVLRAGAAVLGGYGYVLGLWLARADLNPEPVATIREWVNRPLGLGEDFGPLAIMLLLLCVGFQVPRLVTVCLPALVAATIAAVALLVGTHAQFPLVWVVGLPLVLIGHVTWRVLDGTLPAWAGVLLGAGCFAAVIAVDKAFTGLDQWWYPVAASLAVLLFLVAARPGAIMTAVAAHPVARGLAKAAEWPVLVGPVLVSLVVGT